MKLDIGGSETIAAPIETLWKALNDPEVLTRCVPGCKAMTETGPDAYKLHMQLRVAAVSGSFEGEIALFDKEEPRTCNIKVSGAGTLGHGNGTARFELIEQPDGTTRLDYQGVGEIGGLVAGVGQRILTSVSKHLIGRFFTALRKEFETA
ncbi:MAG TPA: carbon monoxide dehydrogenase subunit G [Xanthobacteraceae bacterium]|nr:carbon monoxide dehydrogenase subunit G [Xanthobacteraceae bacterium]